MDEANGKQMTTFHIRVDFEDRGNREFGDMGVWLECMIKNRIVKYAQGQIDNVRVEVMLLGD